VVGGRPLKYVSTCVNDHVTMVPMHEQHGLLLLWCILQYAMPVFFVKEKITSWCGVVWCGVVWCGVVWCGVVWCGVVWCGVVWCGVVWCGVVWCRAVPCRAVPCRAVPCRAVS
jgi:hypothetical protein